MNANIWQRLSFIFKIILLTALIGFVFSGCLSNPQQTVNDTMPQVKNKTPVIQPVIDYNPLGGYTQKKGEGFYIISGNITEVKKELESLITGKSVQQSIFPSEEPLNLVVFRGVFGTGGHGIGINKVEISGYTLTIHATYTDPGPGMMTSQAFTQPTAIIPLGRLAPGTYGAVLIVTRVQKGEAGSKTLEDHVEQGRIDFDVA